EVAGSGAALVDFVSLMRADVRSSGMLRPDLLAALRGLAPAFIRWPGGSFASTYKWQDGIGPLASRVYHPNELWGGYSDYYGFGSALCQTGVQRIRDYLLKLRDYVRASPHTGIRLAVLEWNLSRTYDWRAGLHAAGSLILYESLTPELTMTAPALLMRNTTDDPTWTSFIYHDHVSWFPGGGYVVEKLFREQFAETYLDSTYG